MTNENTHPTSYKDATGKLIFGLTNDYMFHAVFQKNSLALKGLISSLLHMNPHDIKNVIITNPIKLGEQIDDKTFILDIEVRMNNNLIQFSTRPPFAKALSVLSRCYAANFAHGLAFDS